MVAHQALSEMPSNQTSPYSNIETVIAPGKQIQNELGTGGFLSGP